MCRNRSFENGILKTPTGIFKSKLLIIVLIGPYVIFMFSRYNHTDNSPVKGGRQMFKLKKDKTAGKEPGSHTEKQAPESGRKAITGSLEDNTAIFKKLFKDDDTFIVRRFQSHKNTGIRCCILFLDGMADIAVINDNIIKPVISSAIGSSEKNALDDIMYQVLDCNSIEKSGCIDTLMEAVVTGNTVFFADGFSEALIISSKGWQTRAIEEPDGEKVIRGPKEGFNESLLVNLSMIRRRLATNNLKFKFRHVGTQSKTKICLCYIEGIVNEQILNELNHRLDNVDIDGMLSSGTLTEFIKDAPLSPFKTIGSTERPDVVSGKLLEGRIAVLVEGCPVALTLPFIFIEYFQSNEDYYINFYFSSINRLLRILSFILTISLPAIYLSLTSFHMEMVPTPMIKSISAARQSVPFPTAIELMLLMISFEILREAGTRMPTNIGQALSIVGALVLGQSAVEARIVSAPVVIIVALTGITGLSMPRLKGAEILTRSILFLFSSVIGLYGYIFGLIGLLIHLFELRSFGVPYMLSLTNFKVQEIKDTAIRLPWIYMKYRPKFITANNRLRKAGGGRRK